MSDERRQFPRINQPLEGTWRGASGASSCRVGDISLGGCFIYGVAQPVIGEETAVTVTIGENLSVTLHGHVISVEAGMGFSVRFGPLATSEINGLAEVLQRLQTTH